MDRLVIPFRLLPRQRCIHSAYLTPWLSLTNARLQTGSRSVLSESPVAYDTRTRSNEDGVTDSSRVSDVQEVQRTASDSAPLRVGVLIVGGGLTGLTAAYELQRMHMKGIPLPSPPHPPTDKAKASSRTTDSVLPFLVAEAAAQVGGCLETQRSRCGDFLWDSGANSFRLTSETHSLVDELGLSQELLKAPKNAPRFAAVDGRLLPLPHSLPSLVRSPILSWKGKAKLARGILFGARPWFPLPFLSRFEGNAATHQRDAPSIADYTSAVLGSEVERKVVGAMVTGIYAGDPACLSMKLALPALKDMLDWGLIRTLVAAGIRRIRSSLRRSVSSPSDGNGTRATTDERNIEYASIRQDSTGGVGGGPSIANFREGMHTLALGLAAALPRRSVHLQTEVTSILPLSDKEERDGFMATLSTPQGEMRVTARHVLVTLHPTQTAQILGTGKGRMPLLGTAAVQQLNALPFASLALVTLAIRPAFTEESKCSRGLIPNGFGFLVSPSEAAKSGWLSLGGISVSRMFDGRAPDGSEVFTAFVGGHNSPNAIQESDDQLVERVVADILKTCDQKGVALLPDPDEPCQPSRSKQGGATENSYYYRVLGVRRWPRAVAQFGLEHSSALEKINTELLQQQQRRYPNSYLLIEGGWVSGVAVGDRVVAGQRAARILVQPVQQVQQA